MRPSLPSIGARLPELTEELAQLEALINGTDGAAALAKMRSIAGLSLRALCDEHAVNHGEDSTLEELLEPLLAKRAIPGSIAAQVRLVDEVAEEGTTQYHVDDGRRALIAFLEWQVGSRSDKKPAEPARAPIGSRRTLILVAGGAIAVGTATAIALGSRSTVEPTVTPPAMVRIAGATFEMGSREDEVRAAHAMCRQVEYRSVLKCTKERELLAFEQLRRVTISPFDLDRDEVTVAEYVEWLNRAPPPDAKLIALPCIEFTAGKFAVQSGRGRFPIVGASWTSARAYCAFRTKRLPTSAEWELAARGADRRMFPWGAAMPDCESVVYGRRDGLGCQYTGVEAAPIGSGKRDVTPDGVRDLGGNVSEWTEDAWGDRPTCDGPCVDPRVDGPATSHRVLRGGNWTGWIGWTRGAALAEIEPDAIRTFIGFRCAASVLVER